MTERRVLSGRLRKLAEDIVNEVESKVAGSDAVAQSQAAYIAENRLKEKGLPPWAVELLQQIIVELIKRFFESRKPSESDADGDVGPVVES